MQAKELWHILREKFQLEDFRRLYSALLHDDILYQGLLKDELFHQAEKHLGGDSDLWTPARLGLLSLGVTEGIDRPSGFQVDQKTLLSAEKFFESLPEVSGKLDNIQQAAWLAVMFWLRFSKNKSLSATIQEMIIEGNKGNSSYELWKTPLAMLFGLLDKPDDLLQSLLSKRGSNSSLAWIAHIVLCQPISSQKKVELYCNTLENASLNQQLSLLSLLKIQGCDELATQVSAVMLKSRNPAVFKVEPQWIDQLEVESLVLKALETQRLADLCQLAGQKEMAETLLDFAEEAYLQNLAGIAGYRTKGEFKNFLSRPIKPASPAMVYDQFLASDGKTIPDLDKNTTDAVSVKGLLAEIIWAKKLAGSGEMDSAIQICQKAVKELNDSPEIQIYDLRPRYGSDWAPELFLDILRNLNLEDEALRLARIFLRHRPADSRLLKYASLLADGKGERDLALEFAVTAAGLQPEGVEENRWLAQLNERYEFWEDAYRQYDLVVRIEKEPQIADLEGLARTAFVSQRMEECNQACDSLLAQKADHPLACSLKGQVLMAGGKTIDGLRFLKKATLLDPGNPTPWLCIAEYYDSQQDDKKVIDELKAALVSCPKSVGILHKLAQSCIHLHQNSEARRYLESALEISPENEKIALDLGRVLVELGDYEAARKLYRLSLSKWEDSNDLLMDFSQNANCLDEEPRAIECLENKIQDVSAPLELRKQYLRLLFTNEFSRLQLDMDCRRLRLAGRVFSDLPLAKDDVVFKCFWADNFRRLGEDRKAQLIYQELVQNPDIRTTGFIWRVKTGLAELAMKNGQFVDAILLLEEAITDQPENTYLKQKLATYYLLNHLPDQATAAAKEVVTMLPEDPGCLTWYADFQIQLGNKQEAIRVLEDALRLSGNRPQFWVALAEVYMRAGDNLAAQKMLSRYKEKIDLPDEIIVRIARVYQKLNHTPEAIYYLERKKSINQDECLAVGFVLGVLYIIAEKPHAANKKAIELLNISPDFTPNLVLLAESFEAQREYQQAVEALEKALLSLDGARSVGEILEIIEEMGILSASEIRRYHAVGQIHSRLARLHRLMGDMAASFDHIKMALDEEPANLQYRRIAIELAQAQMNYDLARQLADEVGDHLTGEDDPEAVLAIIGFQAEIALDCGDLDKADYWISHGLRLDHQSPRILATQARLMSRRGEISKAQSMISSIRHHEVGDELWLGDAYLDCRIWDSALQIYERFVTRHPEHLHAKYRLAKLLIQIIETARLYAELDAVTHAPCSNLSEQALQDKVIRLVRNVEPFLGNDQAVTLTWRAKGAFAPTRESFVNLVERNLTPEMVSSLVAQARWLELPKETIDFAKTFLMYPEVCIQLAMYYQEEDPEVGVEIAKQAVSMIPADPIGYCVQARLFKANGDLKPALESLESALAIWNDEPCWQSQAAEIARALGDNEGEVMHLKAAIAQRPDCVTYKIDLGKVLMEAGKSEEAIEILREAVRREPYHEEAWLQLAIANRRACRLEEALKCSSYAVSINSCSIPGLMISGRTAMDLGRHEEALRFANTALRFEPRNVEGILLAVNALERSNRKQEAMTILEKALANEENPILVQERARLLAENQGAKPAIAYLKTILERMPENPNLLKQLAELLISAGNPREAEVYAQQALRIIPESAELNLLMGMLQRKAGNLDKSIRHLSESILNNPAGIDAYLELAKAYQQRRDHYESLKIYQQAINICPNDHRAYFGAAGVLKDSKDYLGAEVMLRKAAELAPDDLDIRRQLGAVIALNLVHNSQEVQSPL